MGEPFIARGLALIAFSFNADKPQFANDPENQFRLDKTAVAKRLFLESDFRLERQTEIVAFSYDPKTSTPVGLENTEWFHTE